MDLISDLPVSFSFNANALRNSLFPNTGLDRPLPQVVLIDVDSIPTGSGNNVTLGPTRTKLFDIAVDVSPQRATRYGNAYHHQSTSSAVYQLVQCRGSQHTACYAAGTRDRRGWFDHRCWRAGTWFAGSLSVGGQCHRRRSPSNSAEDPTAISTDCPFPGNKHKSTMWR